jgi:hypothetical protein
MQRQTLASKISKMLVRHCAIGVLGLIISHVSVITLFATGGALVMGTKKNSAIGNDSFVINAC